MKTQLTANEFKALTPSQRAKYRKMFKEYNAILEPVRSAKIRLEDEMRKQAYIDLQIDQRVKAVSTPIREQMAEIERQRNELSQKWQELANRLSDETLTIQTEAYSAGYNHPQVQALSAIWQDINEAHAKKLEEFLSSTQSVEVA